MMTVYTVIIPAAGKGTRFFPFTALVPKEMVPIMQYPAIDYIAHEYEKAGISSVILVINDSKQMIVDYLTKIRESEKKIDVTSVFQQKALGLGHAVLQAKEHVSGHYLGVMLPDDIIFSKVPVIQQLAELSEKYAASVIAIKKVPENKVSSYGIVSIAEEVEPGVFRVEKLVEKPEQKAATSNYAIVGRYVLDNAIFEALLHIKPGAKGEYQLTDAINILLEKKNKVLAVLFEGDHFDVGTPVSWAEVVLYCSKRQII